MTDLIPFLRDGPASATVTLALAHGAGAPMDSPFMESFAHGLARHDLRVVRFEFPYMAARREFGGKRPPDREAVLCDTWRQVIHQLGNDNLIIGGKSLGGRIASLVADEARVSGLVCLGYPFHPPRQPDKLRIEHLRRLETPTLILQGERDPFGTPGQVAAYELSSMIRVKWLPDGDHGFKPRQASGRTERQNWDEAIVHVADFVENLPRRQIA